MYCYLRFFARKKVSLQTDKQVKLLMVLLIFSENDKMKIRFNKSE